MKTTWQKILAMVAGLLSLVLVAGNITGCAHRWLDVDVMGDDGYRHHGYYDNDHYWHGGWYDQDRHYHEDPREWRH